jgi:hypothetical protein
MPFLRGRAHRLVERRRYTVIFGSGDCFRDEAVAATERPKSVAQDDLHSGMAGEDSGC